MDGYLSYFSAAKVWNIPCIEAVIGKVITENDASDTTAFSYNGRFRSNGRKVHSTQLALPPGAITTRDGRKVASPELLFLELACKLSIHRLILLGLQLCSHPAGLPIESAITTKQKLSMFLAKAIGHRGHRKATRAIKYVENGSASIMESLAYMVLRLPYALGGYGLSGAVFNHKIKLKSEGQIRLGQTYCFTDLYYKQAKLAVEYESCAYHNSPSEQGKDAIRSTVLQRQGVNVIHLNTIQLYNRDACRDFAYNLASHLGKRIQIHTDNFDEMHALLRELFPVRKPDNEQQNR